MDRYYLSDILGDGTDEGGDYRPATADYRYLNTNGAIPWDDAANKPKNIWMLVKVVFGDVSVLAGDTRLDPLPAYPLETEVSQMDPGQVATVAAALARRGVGVSLAASETLGSIVAAIGRRAEEGNVTPAGAQLAL